MLSRVLWPRHPMLLVIWSRHPILSESFLLKHLMLSAGEEQPHCCRSRSMYPRTQSVLTQLWNYVPRDPDLWVLTQLWTHIPQDTLSVVCLDPALWPMYPGPRPLSVVLTQFSLTSLHLLHTRGLICAWKSSHKHSNKDLSHLQKRSPGMCVNTSYINSTRGTSMFPLTCLLGPAGNLGILPKSNSQTLSLNNCRDCFKTLSAGLGKQTYWEI